MTLCVAPEASGIGATVTGIDLAQFLFRHRWAPDTLLMWDNRVTLHFAEGGYDGHLRVMHRSTVAGEAVIGTTH